MTLATPAGGPAKGSAPASRFTSTPTCPNCGCDLRGRTMREQAEQARVNALLRDKAVRVVRLHSIADAVARFYNLTFNSLIEPERATEVSLARQVAMYLLFHSDPSVGYSEIGRFLKRDHSTVLHGVSRIRYLAANRPWLAEDLVILGARLGIAA
jgi:chromosomal replication initiator protein